MGYKQLLFKNLNIINTTGYNNLYENAWYHRSSSLTVKLSQSYIIYHINITENDNMK